MHPIYATTRPKSKDDVPLTHRLPYISAKREELALSTFSAYNRLIAMSRDILSMSSEPADARLQYGADQYQFGDLRFPSSPPPHPVVVGIHGGYYRAMYGLDYYGPLCESLRGVGIATWNIEYRRLGNAGGGWPGTFLDVAHAIDYLRELASQYGLDLARVVTLGHSAGGHLALWVAARRRIQPGNTLYMANPLPIKAAISLAGVLDTRRAWELRLSSNVTEELLGGTPAEEPERYASVSPYELLPLGLPQALIHGTADTAVPMEMAIRYHEAAQAKGEPVTLLAPQDAGHFEIVDPRTPEWAQVMRVVQQLL
jgi:acetyl esterase/lipase